MTQNSRGGRTSLVSTGLLERAVRHFKGVEAGRGFAQTPGAPAFVAVAGEEIQGWCWGYHLPRPDASSMLCLHELDVEAAHRRQGIGRDLLRAFIAEGTKLGATKMFLFTGADNAPARSL
nr:GNAT family N-acetyltransferase [Actinopolymorpha pittospori]